MDLISGFDHTIFLRYLECSVFSKDLHNLFSALLTFTDTEMKMCHSETLRSGQEMQQTKFCHLVKYMLLQPRKTQPSTVSCKAAKSWMP